MACLPVGGSTTRGAAGARRKRVVYVPACVTRMMGPARGDDGAGDDAVHAKLFSLINKAG